MQDEDPLGGARRILVYGVTGSGKTVAAQRISEATRILDTAYGQWVGVPLGTADLIIALDYPRWLSLRQTFSRESIIAWHFRSFASKRARIQRWEQDEEAPRVLRFRRSHHLERWIESLRSTATGN